LDARDDEGDFEGVPPMKISQDAFDLIVKEEDSSEAYYTKHYQHFDWPAGASGPTIGIGYDLGYVTKAEVEADWKGIVADDMLAWLQKGVGYKGSAARSFVAQHKDKVTITWEQALQEFSDKEVPKWEEHVAKAVPNTELLSGDSFGALVSLAYNRGAGIFSNPGPRYSEGRAIKALMAEKAFDKVPAEFLSMRRLWPRDGDLWKRREHEAYLFQKGLQA
jgi:GH24 family phage-related lysozyme (muramidase)